MFEDMYLEYSFMLLFIFVFIFCEKYCKMKVPSLYFPHANQFMKSTLGTSKLVLFLKWLGIIALLTSLASPVRDERYEVDPKDGYEIALILDASESMLAKGFDVKDERVNRFDVVKEIVSDFIKQRKDDNIGLVVFGSYSFIAAPLTYDERILNRIVSQLQIGMAGKYTALYVSLAQGVNLLKGSESKSKIAILLTDGHSTAQIDKIPLEVALDMAKKEGIKVYPIGIGLPHEYNQHVLSQIAEGTGGVAFGASSARELENIYKQINELEKSKIKNESFSYVKYYYMYSLLIAFFSLLAYMYLKNKRADK